MGARPRRSRKLASCRRTTLFGPFLDACIPGIHRRKRRRYRRLPSSDCVARGPRKHGLECKQASRRWCCCAVSFMLTRFFCFVCEQCCVPVPPYGVLLRPPEKQNQSGLSSYQVCSVGSAAGGEKVCPVEQQRETSIRRAVPILPPLERQMGATRAAGKRRRTAKVKVGLCGSPSLLPPLIPRPPPRITARLDSVQSLRCFVSAWPWLPGWCPVVHRARLLRGAFCSQHRLLLFIASSNICFLFLFLLYYWGGGDFWCSR